MWTVRRELLNLYDRAKKLSADMPFETAALQVLDVRYELNSRGLSKIPPDGPVVVVANHPSGALEGLVLLDILRRVRFDTRVLANSMLSQIPELAPRLICVDPFASAKASTANVAPLSSALRSLRRGELLALFPAGEVAHWRWRSLRIEESPWLPTAAWLARRSQAKVVPMNFRGHSDKIWQLAGLLSPRLRTALLPLRLLHCRGTSVEVEIGEPISADELEQLGDDIRATRELRDRTLALVAARA